MDWYPWGEEAFARARAEDKPVFLSVGYSTCHWCHVMERESFTHPDVAALLNAHFVAVKVDREERPELDEIYLAATQLLTGRGGWPNSVWLTPDGRPWYAGTYFPREDHPGRPGFLTVLKRLAAIWRTDRSQAEAQADRLAEAVRFQAAPASATAAEEGDDPWRALVTGAIQALRGDFDEAHGGFGEAPKFPPHGSLALLLHEYERAGEEALRAIITRTLDGMARGGIRDHLGGGFHRYATDERWFLPHFEKMLYDNAQLARHYSDAFSLTGAAGWGEAAREIYDWVLREMTSPEGAFYCALDADSEGEEGKFYLWSAEEIRAVLGHEEGERFGRIYGLQEDGNFAEEAGGRRPGTNILHLPRPLEEAAREEGLTVERLRQDLAAQRQALLARRVRRAWPSLDDKVLASWNGLMLGSLAHGGRRLGEGRYVEAATRAAEFVLTRMTSEGRLCRACGAGEARGAAYLEDYVFVADGLLDVHDATGEARWLEEARSLMDTAAALFEDREVGGFFFTSEDHEVLLARLRDPFDRALPSANGVAARVLLRLARLTGEAGYREKARRTLSAFRWAMARAPRGTEALLLAAALYAESAAAPAVGPVVGGMPRGQETTAGPEARAATGPVTVEAYVPRLAVARGGTLALAVRVRVSEGWHVNSEAPHDEYLIPTALTLADSSVFGLDTVSCPEGRDVRFVFSDTPLSVYDGEFLIRATLRALKRAKPGRHTATLQLTVQPCNDESCLPPEDLVLAIPLEVVKRLAREPARHPDLFPEDGGER